MEEEHYEILSGALKALSAQISRMRKWTYCLASALTTGLPQKNPFLLALWTSGVYLWL